MGMDERYMRMAIKLAKMAEGLTNPNPVVGAVIVKNGKVIGKGYHKACGGAHAEINALEDAGDKSKGASLYVTLEPCDHFGRTPPCTNEILKRGIRKVVVGMRDPNPINDGRGIRKLNKHGVKTVVGVLKEEVRSINRPYIKFITKKMPYVTIKVAESIDGKIATKTGDSKWITSDDSRRYVHHLRGRVDAVMVGINTVVRDDPLLTARLGGSKQPARIIVDSRLETPLKSRIFSNLSQSPVIIAAAHGRGTRKARMYEAKGARLLFVKSKKNRVDLADLFKRLGEAGLMHILVEAGGELAASLVEAHLVDRFLFFIAPKIIGGRDAVTSIEGRGINKVGDAILLKNIKLKRFDDDILIEAEAG